MHRSLLIVLVFNTIAAFGDGACNSTEKALWHDNQAFSLQISKFAVSAFGRAAGVVDRLQGAYPAISADCAGCFGEAVACGTRHCFFSCVRSSTSPECVACSQENCTPQLKQCIGVVDDSELPPPPPHEETIVTTSKPPRTRKLAAKRDLPEIVAIVFGEGSSASADTDAIAG